MVEVLERQEVLDAIEEVFKYRHSDISREDLIFVRQAIRELPSYDVYEGSLENRYIYYDDSYNDSDDNDQVSEAYHEALDDYIDKKSDDLLKQYKELITRPKFDFED